MQFIIRHDSKSRFRFASLQSAAGVRLLKEYGYPVDKTDSVVLIKGKKAWHKSSATLRLLHELGGLWHLAIVFFVFPKFIRDYIYDHIANSRYRLFGKGTSCPLPTPEIAHRFLLK